jgi:hypothetical protein
MRGLFIAEWRPETTHEIDFQLYQITIGGRQQDGDATLKRQPNTRQRLRDGNMSPNEWQRQHTETTGNMSPNEWQRQHTETTGSNVNI